MINLFNPLRRMNWIALICMLILMAIGVFCVYSANFSRESLRLQQLYRQHAELAVAGTAICLILPLIDYRVILKFSWLLYAGSILLLVAVLLAGTEQMGARRWVFGIQPAEFAKISTIMLLASYLGRENARRDIFDYLTSGVIVLLPMALILKQPDLGTSLVFIPILVIMLFVAGTAPRALFHTCLAGILAITLVIGSVVLRENQTLSAPVKKVCSAVTCMFNNYQVGRLLDFVFPERDPMGRGWNRRQSQIAIGSGGMWGKGYLKGDQNILGYLPQQVSANDFIFSVLAEEEGHVGSIFVLLCFGGILLSTLSVAAICQDGTGRLLCTGVAALIFCHVFVNIGMTIGLLPVTGLPLPFLSYGRTFMLTVTFAMGLVQSVSTHSSRREAAEVEA